MALVKHKLVLDRYVGAMNYDISTLRRILQDNKTVAIVGLSANWYRPSYFVAKYLQGHEFRVVPVNPRYAQDAILGEQCYASLRDIPIPVDVVDCFRRANDILPIVEEAIEIGAKVLWMQLGVVNEEAAETARAAGLDVIMDRCMKIEFGRIFGGLNYMGVNTKVISAKRQFSVPHRAENGRG